MGIGYIPESDEKIAKYKLKPCPFCGRDLILTSDHHGAYWEHPQVRDCYEAVAQITDKNEMERWNRRSPKEVKDV